MGASTCVLALGHVSFGVPMSRPTMALPDVAWSKGPYLVGSAAYHVSVLGVLGFVDTSPLVVEP
jgi:hypothetical protein